jgi:TPR repeat protein
MEMKIGTKAQFGIIILLGIFIYVFWLELLIGTIHIYALTGNAHSKRILGEYYAAKSADASVKAAMYFQQALESYEKKLPGTPEEQRKWIEFLIGNQYECGKGVSADLIKAKYWYQQAIKNGFPKEKTSLDRINEALREMDNTKTTKTNKKIAS